MFVKISTKNRITCSFTTISYKGKGGWTSSAICKNFLIFRPWGLAWIQITKYKIGSKITPPNSNWKHLIDLHWKGLEWTLYIHLLLTLCDIGIRFEMGYTRVHMRLDLACFMIYVLFSQNPLSGLQYLQKLPEKGHDKL